MGPKRQKSNKSLSLNKSEQSLEDLQIAQLSQTQKKIKTSCSFGMKLQSNSYDQIPFLPVHKLTKDQMNGDPVKLFLQLQQKYKKFGAIKLVSCQKWSPPFCFVYAEGITTRIQKIHKLKKGKAFEEIEGRHSVKTYKEFATKFSKDYIFQFQKQGKTTQSQLQNEFWNLVKGQKLNEGENPNKYKVRVQYAADLPVSKHGSGFPLTEKKGSKDDNFDYKQSLFNLNNLYKCPNSILKIAQEKKEFISGITIPWVYMGMMFSTFCWHVQDLWLNSVNYSHTGSIKVWYVIPESDKEKFDAFVFERTGSEQILDRITYMLDPLEILKAGIKVYKTYQQPGDYICTFIKAYHAGFSQGYNVGQAVNFVSPESLEIIKQAQKSYEKNKQRKPSVLSIEWLAYENAKNSSNPLIKQQYEKILQSELNYLKEVISKFKINLIEQLPQKSKYDKNSCSTCRKYLYLSSIKCSKCQKNYCHKHLHDCCGKGFVLVSRTSDGQRQKNIQQIETKL